MQVAFGRKVAVDGAFADACGFGNGPKGEFVPFRCGEATCQFGAGGDDALAGRRGLLAPCGTVVSAPSARRLIRRGHVCRCLPSSPMATHLLYSATAGTGRGVMQVHLLAVGQFVQRLERSSIPKVCSPSQE